MFIGRTKELAELEHQYQKNTFGIVALYGRRRIGKSRLIKEFIKNKSSVYMMALESGFDVNLEILSAAIYAAFPDEDDAASIAPFESLNLALQYLTQKSKKQKTVVVIDEYQYFIQSDKNVFSVFQEVIDREWKNTNIMLILCCSSMNSITQSAFRAQVTSICLEPLNYYEASLFVPHYTPEQKALVYGITGGVPQYLELMDDLLSIKENVMDMYLSSSAYLFEEPSNLIKRELKEPSNYNSIIAAIARGADKLNMISSEVHMENSNVSTCLRSLISLGLVEKRLAITEEDNKKKTSYRLSDQMFRFWYRYIPQCLHLIHCDEVEQAYDNLIAPSFPGYMKQVFETICLQHLTYLNLTGKLPFEISRFGHWWGNHPVSRQQETIDLVGVHKATHTAVFGECSYQNEQTDISRLNLLMEQSKLFSDYSQRYYILYAKCGFTPDLYDCVSTKKDKISLFTLDELYDRAN